jgi:hypothetical protein
LRKQQHPGASLVTAGDKDVPADLDQELSGYYLESLRVDETVEGFLATVREDQIRWRPGPERWSVGECIEHLIIVGSLVVAKLNEAILRSRAEGLTGAGPYHYSWPGRMFIDSLQPNSRLRVKTLKMYTPSGVPGKEQLTLKFHGLQEQYREALVCASGLDLVRVKVASPANRMLRFSLGVWFAATLAHEQRHVEQARRLTMEPGFPR